MRRRLTWYRRRRGRCPQCGHRFSDWFCWGAKRYCFLCWRDSNYQQIYTE